MNVSSLLLGCLLLCSSCSLAFDASRKQCNADEDCAARGLIGSTCVAHLCQTLLPAAGSGMMTSPIATAGMSGGAGGAQRPPDPPNATAGMSGAAAAGRSGSAAAAGMSGADDDAGIPAGPPECTVDGDCERIGVAGGTCVDQRCWAPMPQCKADADCVKLGPEFIGGRCLAGQCRPNPKWRCEPTPPPSQTGTIELIVPIVDSLTLSNIPNVHIVACNKLDLMCMMPVANATSGADGNLRIKVPANFAGYLQQTDRRDYAPAMYFLPSTLPADGKMDNFPLLLSGTIIDAIAVALGAGLDPSRGHLILIADDCAGDPQAGITFTSPQMDAKTVQFYVRDQLPSTTAKDTPAAGDGGYLNFPAGTAVITVKEAKTGLEITTASVLVRPGFMSVAYFRPDIRVQN